MRVLRTTYLGGLLEWLLVDSDEDDGMRSETVLSSSLHVLDDIAALGKVDERVRAKLLCAHLLLVVTSVDGNGPQSHGLSVLLGEGSESTSGTDDGDGLAWTGSRLLQSLVDGDTGAENWSDGIEGNVLVQTSDVGGFGDAVLLERAVDCVAGKESLGAQRLVGLLAEVAGKAGTVDPL